ncbi:hypothetical protein OG864_52695 [Streptomyces sp. NBC_00124]|uniref:hypothetical protein n=1 Tax=Streptomyces sp. NBC_00124 TaxID=2975662 RepID=UPI00224F614D|nr:hypothetical protein [Streptomyces sp. NBC_00124]MCX5367317.1 hypothetical protein [Streptomyces sp. NBC_00124]
MHGIGPRQAAVLRDYGIHCVGLLAAVPAATVHRPLGGPRRPDRRRPRPRHRPPPRHPPPLPLPPSDVPSTGTSWTAPPSAPPSSTSWSGSAHCCAAAPR